MAATNPAINLAVTGRDPAVGRRRRRGRFTRASSIALAAAFGAASATDVCAAPFVLDPVVVEADRPSESPAASEPNELAPQVLRRFDESWRFVQPTAPTGATQIVAPVNEAGVSLVNSEGIEEISEVGAAASTGAPTQLQVDAGPESQLKAQISTPGPGTAAWKLEGGYGRQRARRLFLDNGGTPEEADDDRLASYLDDGQNAFAKISLRDSRALGLAEWDLRQRELRAGARAVGRQSGQQFGLSGAWQSSPQSHRADAITLRPFYFLRDQRVDSSLDELADAEWRSHQGGIEAVWPVLPAIELGARLSHESIIKNWEFGAIREARYARTATEVRARAETVGPLGTEWVVGGSAIANRDQMPGRAASPQGGFDLASSVSTSSAARAGVTAAGRRYVILPTPSQKFGDGALIGASPDLPAQSGLRLSAGPWWQANSAGTRASASVFSEQVRNIPIWVATSPLSARALPIGGVWSRGVELRAGATRSFGAGEAIVDWRGVWQEALNDSSINWQRGQRVPGYPDLLSRLELSYRIGRWQAGADHEFRGREALDLSGAWLRQPRHLVGASFGYHATRWGGQLRASNLLNEIDQADAGGFAGAAPDLVQAPIAERALSMQMEFKL